MVTGFVVVMVDLSVRGPAVSVARYLDPMPSHHPVQMRCAVCEPDDLTPSPLPTHLRGKSRGVPHTTPYRQNSFGTEKSYLERQPSTAPRWAMNPVMAIIFPLTSSASAIKSR